MSESFKEFKYKTFLAVMNQQNAHQAQMQQFISSPNSQVSYNYNSSQSDGSRY